MILTESWDWAEQPNLESLARSLAKLGVYLMQVETGTDDYAIVLSDRQLTADEAVTAWEDRIGEND
jgi:hypothetical protein